MLDFDGVPRRLIVGESRKNTPLPARQDSLLVTPINLNRLWLASDSPIKLANLLKDA